MKKEEERPCYFQTNLNLYNLFANHHGYFIPSIVAIDTRLSWLDMCLFSIFLNFVKNDSGQCSPTLREIAKEFGTTAQSIIKRRDILGEYGYLRWEMRHGGRSNIYYLQLPIEQGRDGREEWIRWCAWQKFYRSPEHFIEKLRAIYRSDELSHEGSELVKADFNQLLYILNNDLSDNKLVDYNKRKNSSLLKQALTSPVYVKTTKKKTDRHKIKNGRGEDHCLSDPSSEYYDDDPSTTYLLAETYRYWKRRNTRSGGGFRPIDRNNPLYKHFVRLRKRLLAFRGDRANPDTQKLFYDYFDFLQSACEDKGLRMTVAWGLDSDSAWELYTSYVLEQYEDYFVERGRLFTVSGLKRRHVA